MIYKLFSSVFFLGCFPVASGTAATFVALILFWFIPVDTVREVVILAFLFIIGIFASTKAERIWQKEDDGRIVIDEFLATGFAVMFLPKKILIYIIAFFLFRFFDIVKPLLINRTQKLPGGYGIMIDDLLAALYTNIIIQIFLLIF